MTDASATQDPPPSEAEGGRGGAAWPQAAGDRARRRCWRWSGLFLGLTAAVGPAALKSMVFGAPKHAQATGQAAAGQAAGHGGAAAASEPSEILPLDEIDGEHLGQ